MTVLTSLSNITRVSTIQLGYWETGVPAPPPPPPPSSGENPPKIDQTGEGLAIQRKYSH